MGLDILKKRIKDSLEDISKEFAVLVEENNKLKTALLGGNKILQFLPYQYNTKILKFRQDGCGSFGRAVYYEIPARSRYSKYVFTGTLADLLALKAEDEAIEKENKRIAQVNLELYKGLAKVFVDLGISLEEVDKNSRKKYGKPYVTKPWFEALRHEFNTYHSANVVSQWDAFINEFRTLEDKKLAEIKEKEKQEAAALKEKEKAIAVTKFVGKYNYDIEDGLPSIAECLDFIIAKDKYLYLAHYLSANRSDWSDGYSYARLGLNGFTAESEQDFEIEADIQACIDSGNDGDIDGRVFRDTTWNYTQLFALADPDFFSDYQNLQKYLEY